jgi:hypothetical protein
MDLYNLVAIVAAQKTSFKMKVETDSFRIAPRRQEPYIEPTFSKVEYPDERPTVVLISAVGATGKSALAQVLSHQTGLPLLDLGKHKPVGDNTLTGLLTSSFSVGDLTAIFEGLTKGTFGVVIDGVDEGRSKTNEKAFQAFLDDIVRLCSHGTNTTFVLLGRTQTLEECWLYFTDKGVQTALVSIDPFDLDAARQYIDRFTGGNQSSFSEQYREVRDEILSTLSSAFSAKSAEAADKFAVFIGYPPVLDAIVTLLLKETNYHRLMGRLKPAASSDMEANLLLQIGSCIADREKQQKVDSNVLMPLVAILPENQRQEILSTTFGLEAQCMRLVAYCLNKPLTLREIQEPLINDQYEKHLASWLPEHPFIAGRTFRNVVFEGMALAVLVVSDQHEAVRLGLEYLDLHKNNYHFVYFLHKVACGKTIPIACLHALLASAFEFISTEASVGVSVEGDSAMSKEGQSKVTTVNTEIEIVMGPSQEWPRTFQFQSEVLEGIPVRLGGRLSETFISLPAEIHIASAQEIEFTTPISISVAKLVLSAPSIVLRSPPKQESDFKFVLLEATTAESNVANIQTNGLDFVLGIADRSGLTYPIIQFVQDAQTLPNEKQLKEKYLGLRRILVQFRSHSRGTMARFKPKIENERVAGNPIGEAILNRLLSDQVLSLKGSHYFLDPKQVDKHLGITWLDLQKGQTTEKLIQYLASIRT